MPGQAFRPYARAASSWGRCGGWKAHEVVVARFGLRDVFRGVVYALRLDQVKTRESVTGEPSSRNPHRHVAHAVACMQAAASSRRAVEPQKCFTDGPLAPRRVLLSKFPRSAVRSDIRGSGRSSCTRNALTIRILTDRNSEPEALTPRSPADLPSTAAGLESIAGWLSERCLGCIAFADSGCERIVMERSMTPSPPWLLH
jgi:hypothetical protein